MPNLPVDVNSWGRSACYPRRTFYSLSDGPSTRDHRITKPWFPICSTCQSHSQAPLCLCTRRLVSVQPEGTFGRLRYSLGGDRPSQTTHQTGSRSRITGCGEDVRIVRVVFHRWLPGRWRVRLIASHLSYTDESNTHCQAIVKVHRVFPSSCGQLVSSPARQFR